MGEGRELFLYLLHLSYLQLKIIFVSEKHMSGWYVLLPFTGIIEKEDGSQVQWWGRKGNQKIKIGFTVSPLHMNEFYSKSTFVSPVCL